MDNLSDGITKNLKFYFITIILYVVIICVFSFLMYKQNDDVVELQKRYIELGNKLCSPYRFLGTKDATNEYVCVDDNKTYPFNKNRYCFISK